METIPARDCVNTSSVLDVNSFITTPPASPLMDEHVFKDLMNETPHITISPSDSDSDLHFNADIHFSIPTTQNVHNHVTVPSRLCEENNTPIFDLTPNCSDVVLSLLGPSIGDELQHIDADTVDKVLPQCMSPFTDNTIPQSSLQENVQLFSDRDLDFYDGLCEPLLSPPASDAGSSAGPSPDTEGEYPSFSFPAPRNVSNVTRLHTKDPELMRLLDETYSDCIREELKLKIKLRRFEAGQGDICFKHTPPGNTISYTANQRRNELREKNKLYARRSRERANVRQLQLEKDHLRLFKYGQQLRSKVNFLKSHLSRLQKLFLNHKKNGCAFGNFLGAA